MQQRTSWAVGCPYQASSCPYEAENFQADLTRPSPVLEHLLASYGGVGLPFLAVLDREGHKKEGFSGLFTSASLVAALKAIEPQENLE
ncbi:MAG: hypothetical protein EPN76_04340 [Burkholderiaceae bacterium]|nr:MAG: hypothetical protein EPN76_04340 [Burkholderiaceae bacterium]TAM02743.1 MAG: hypothetical protein EPN67_10600 [Pusillimonas sp.]